MVPVPPKTRHIAGLPLVTSLTALVLVVPCLAGLGLRASGLVTSPVLLVLIPVLVSILISQSIAEFWKRRRAGSPLLFEDLMLWGWLRRRRFERLVDRSDEFVGSQGNLAKSSKQRARELERLAGALEARDPHTHGHSKRVARHAISIAKALQLPADEVARIRTAALLHDIGKIEVPREILEKPAALTDEEFEEVKKHPVAGSRLISGMDDPELVAIVRHHHERIDGRGYPDGLVRGQIPLGARIVAVADTFDALTSARAYRAPRSHEDALEVLREEAGSQLDARAVRAFDGRYSSRGPVALTAAALGIARQAGQTLIGFGTGASQVAAVGGAAAVIGVAPAVQTKHQKEPPRQPAVVRQAEAPSGAVQATAEGPVSVADGTPTVTVPAAKSGHGPRVRDSKGRGTGGVSPGKEPNPSNGGGGKPENPTGGGKTEPGSGGGENSGGSSGGGGDPGGSTGEGSTGGSSDGPGGGSNGGSGGGSTGGPSGDSPGLSGSRPGLNRVTEVVTKPLQQVTERVTETIPTLPGKDPVSQGINDTVAGVKDTLGKLTGKP